MKKHKKHQPGSSGGWSFQPLGSETRLKNHISSLAGLEVPERFMVEQPELILWGGFQVSTMSNPAKLLLSCFELS